MSSLDNFHLEEGGEWCWCIPTVTPIFANDGNFRLLIVHNKVDIEFLSSLYEADKDVIDKILDIIEQEMKAIDVELAKWWAVHEYAKLGS